MGSIPGRGWISLLGHVPHRRGEFADGRLPTSSYREYRDGGYGRRAAARSVPGRGSTVDRLLAVLVATGTVAASGP